MKKPETLFKKMHDLSLSRCFTSTRSYIEDISGQHFTENNFVQFLESGQNTFQLMLDAISQARKFICIEFYIFKDDDTGKKVAESLKAKASEGVKVYLLYDHFGSFLTSRKFWSGLKKAGIHIRASHPFRWTAPRGYKYRNHKKLIVIDGEKAIIGGFNIADEYYGYFKKQKKIWHDTGIYLEGPIAVSLYNIFRKSWIKWKGEPFQDVADCIHPSHGVPVIPIFANSGRERRKMRRLLMYSIRNAEKSVYISTAYFNPGLRILRALVHASKRGVDLKLLLAGKTDVKPVYYAGRSHYKKLLKVGAEIYDYTDGILHSKTAVFDGCWSIIGSTNLDNQSLRRNEESNVGVLDTRFGREMTVTFQNDLVKSLKINLSDWDKRPLYRKIMEKIFSVIIKKL